MSDYFPARGDVRAPQITPQRFHRRGSRPPTGYVSVAELATRARRAKSVVYRDIERGWLRCHSWRGKKCVAEADAVVWLSPVPLEPGAPADGAAVLATVKDAGNV